MLKIGEFAKICATGTQTLRYYDQIGVLKADYIDCNTGYRYYKADKLDDYRLIVELKEAGFSLDEIKLLLKAPVAQRKALFDAKRRELNGEELDLQHKKEKLRRLFENSVADKISIPGVYQITNHLFSGFKEDPDAVGCWKLEGLLNSYDDLSFDEDWSEYLNNISAIDMEKYKEHVHETIYFLPGGASYWVFFWSKGVLYRMSADLFGYCVANPYEIRLADGVRWMLLKWVIVTQEENVQVLDLLYRQEDDRVYNESSVRLKSDNINLSFVPDDRVIGTWTAVDYVENPDWFDPARHREQDLFYSNLVFRERGICYRSLNNINGGRTMMLKYTKGYVINREERTAEMYEIRTINGSMYLLVEHKSGDYIYGGRNPYVYVYRKEKDQL